MIRSGRCAATNSGESSKYGYAARAFGPARAPEDGSARTGQPASPASRSSPAGSALPSPQITTPRSVQGSSSTGGTVVPPITVQGAPPGRPASGSGQPLTSPAGAAAASPAPGLPAPGSPAPRAPPPRSPAPRSRVSGSSAPSTSGTSGSRRGRLRCTGPGAVPGAPEADAQARQA